MIGLGRASSSRRALVWRWSSSVWTSPSGCMALLGNPGVEKVFHHAPFDLRFMVHAWGSRPATVRCTKVASKLLEPRGPNDAHSLQQLVFRYLGVSLTKGEVRTSDWSAPRLSAAQLEYAAGDVLYLLELLDALQKQLEGAGLAELYDACCAFLPARVILDLGGLPGRVRLLSGTIRQQLPLLAGEEVETGCGCRSQPCEQPQVPWRVGSVDMINSHRDGGVLHQSLQVLDNQVGDPADRDFRRSHHNDGLWILLILWLRDDAELVARVQLGKCVFHLLPGYFDPDPVEDLRSLVCVTDAVDEKHAPDFVAVDLWLGNS